MPRIEFCPACGSGNLEIVAEMDADSRVRFLAYSKVKYGGLLDTWLSDIEIVILKCEMCAHHCYREQPSVTQLSEMYATGRPLVADFTPSRLPTREMIREMQRLRRMLDMDKPALLDYGSGFGRWARAAQAEGFSVHAYEPSQSRGEEEEASFTIVHELASLGKERFDVINLEQVLEHVPDPLTTLQGIHEWCLPHSVIRISVPNILRCDEGRNIWKEWPYNGSRAHFMAPFEHLHGFTPKSLRRLVDRAGYAVVNDMKSLAVYPLVALRRWAEMIMPSLGQTFLIVRPTLEQHQLNGNHEAN